MALLNCRCHPGRVCGLVFTPSLILFCIAGDIAAGWVPRFDDRSVYYLEPGSSARAAFIASMAIVSLLAVLLFVAFFRCALTEPGPIGPFLQLGHPAFQSPGSGVPLCAKGCNTPKPFWFHHCSSCTVCIDRLDHHCPWIGQCIGRANHKFFILFLMYLGIGGSLLALTTADVFVTSLTCSSSSGRHRSSGGGGAIVPPPATSAAPTVSPPVTTTPPPSPPSKRCNPPSVSIVFLITFFLTGAFGVFLLFFFAVAMFSAAEGTTKLDEMQTRRMVEQANGGGRGSATAEEGMMEPTNNNDIEHQHGEVGTEEDCPERPLQDTFREEADGMALERAAKEERATDPLPPTRIHREGEAATALAAPSAPVRALPTMPPPPSHPPPPRPVTTVKQGAVANLRMIFGRECPCLWFVPTAPDLDYHEICRVHFEEG